MPPAEVTTQSGRGSGPRWLGVTDGQVDYRWSGPGSTVEKVSAVNSVAFEKEATGCWS